MSRKINVKQITEIECENASLTFSLQLPIGSGSAAGLELNYDCAACGGHGCRGGCDNSQYIEMKHLKQSLGKEQAEFFLRYLENMVAQLKAS
jgi:hypothetical protein